MYISTQAIVISKLKYGDSDLIIKCFTEKLGVQNYLLKGILRSKKGKLKPAYFQLFSLLEIQATNKDNRELQYIKEAKPFVFLSSIYSDIEKSTIVLFLSEVLNFVLVEESQNVDLFEFLASRIVSFESQPQHANFHFTFLLELTKYLGFAPDLENTNLSYFDLKEGRFSTIENSNYVISGIKLDYFKDLLGIKFDRDKKPSLKPNQKRELLNMILLYFKLHLGGFKEPKSLAVLNQVFE